MNRGIIIFARYDSSRLPGKAVIDIEGRSLLQRVIDRARQVVGSPSIIVATSTRDLEQPIIDCVRNEGIELFQGDLCNVARRAFDCASQFGLTYFARVCGDRPFFDPGLVSCYLERAEEKGLDLATNAIGNTFPPGLTTEVIRTKALARLLKMTNNKDDLEHVTRYFYRCEEQFAVDNYTANENWRDISLVVDTPDDLDRARFIMRRLGVQPERANMARVVAEARLWYRMNSHCGVIEDQLLEK